MATTDTQFNATGLVSNPSTGQAVFSTDGTNALIRQNGSAPSLLIEDQSGNPIPAKASEFLASGAVVAGTGSAPSAFGGDLVASRTSTQGVLTLGGSSTAGYLDFGIAYAGDWTFGQGNVHVYQGALVAGSATAPSPFQGDIVASRNASQGVLTLGGSTSAGYLDYGINQSGSWTFGQGNLNVYQGAVIAGSATAPTPFQGDLVASRNSTQGVLTLGGNSSAGYLDFGYTHAGQWTFGQGQVNTQYPISSASRSNSTTTAAYVPPVYDSSGSALASTTHIVTGTTSLRFFSSNTASVGVSWSGAAVFASAPRVFLQIIDGAAFNGAFADVSPTSVATTGFTLLGFCDATQNSTYTVFWMAIGA